MSKVEIEEMIEEKKSKAIDVIYMLKKINCDIAQQGETDEPFDITGTYYSMKVAISQLETLFSED